jgi:hypothetical protein
MSSNTQQTRTIRRRRDKTQGKVRKRKMRAQGTPAFPVHPEGYDPNAPDARRAEDGADA